MPIHILPSILAADHGKFIAESQTVDIPEIEYLHVDVMDGHFVPNITFGPNVVASLKKNTRFKLDVHLMIENPDQYIPQFAAAGAEIITVHQEACVHLHRTVSLIRDHGAKAGVAINPATSPETLRWILDSVDLVLVMSVNPGFGGQSFIPSSLEKLQVLYRWREEFRYRYLLEIDGGIDTKTIAGAISAGAEMLVAGSAIFGNTDRINAIQNLRNAAKNQAVSKKI